MDFAPGLPNYGKNAAPIHANISRYHGIEFCYHNSRRLTQ